MSEPITLHNATLYHGDCLEQMRALDAESVDAIVTDPPYGLSFMGRHWDYDVPSVEVWREALRVLKPGGHLLSFSSARTYHRMVVAIEDAGFEVRDQIMWVYGSGFPKSLDVSKALDRMAGAERDVVGVTRKSISSMAPGEGNFSDDAYQWKSEFPRTAPATEAAQRWAGWGTALKPAHEPICLARKPLIGTVADNVLAHGTGALNVDGCRIPAGGDSLKGGDCNGSQNHTDGWDRPWRSDPEKVAEHSAKRLANAAHAEQAGRWPANLIHDGSDEVVGLFPESGGSGPARALKRGKRDGDDWGMADQPGQLRDAGTGSAARFFYTAKAHASDRDEGLAAAQDRILARSCQAQAEAARGHVVASSDGAFNKARIRKNHHPTVKPTDLMRYLCRLITPPGGLILDPYMGSGSTGKGAVLEGFRFVGIEREADYLDIAAARIRHAQQQPDLFHEACALTPNH